MEAKILLIEDDSSLGYLISEYLKMKGFEVDWEKNGNAGLLAAGKKVYDLCILDVMMPEMDGFTLAQHLRELPSAPPFLFLTAKSLKVDVLKGLSLGAEDYLKKPIDEEELVLRIKNILRRTQSQARPEATQSSMRTLGKYRYDTQNQQLIYQEEVIQLTNREHELLSLLVKNQGRLCKRKEILNALWGNSDYFNRKSMDVFISRLRRYLSEDERINIENVYGKGFILTIGES